LQIFKTSSRENKENHVPGLEMHKYNHLVPVNITVFSAVSGILSGKE
jgi:hypothetical protein